MLDSCKLVQKQSEAFHTFLWHFYPSLKYNFIEYHSSKVSDCIFEINQLWQSGFSRVYSNSCCSCSFKPEIINTVQSSHKMYSNNIMNFQESTTILNASTKKSRNLLHAPRMYVTFFAKYLWGLVFICHCFSFPAERQTREEGAEEAAQTKRWNQTDLPCL